jgi:hypothetical protein
LWRSDYVRIKTRGCNRGSRYHWHKLFIVNRIKRYWAAGLIIVVVVAHASIIGYVRSRVARLSLARSTALEIGTFRFQNIKDSGTVYQFRLYAIADPSRRYQAEENLKQMRVEILESAEQLLRQIEPEWLADPSQAQIRDRLMDVVGKHFNEPLVQRVIITDWLQFPTATLSTTVTSMPPPPGPVAAEKPQT